MDWKLDGSDNQRIREWLAKEENEYNCDECPYNKGCSHMYEDILPCGQYNCWVTCTVYGVHY